MPRTSTFAGALAVLSCALGAADADLFTYGSVPDGTVATRDGPVSIVDPGNPDLHAVIRPLGDVSTLVKTPPDPAFPQGSAGAMAETTFLPGGVEIRFSQPVFCVPGFDIGVPIGEPVGEWATFMGREPVAEGTFVAQAGDQGVRIGQFSIPEGVIDRVEIRAYVITGSGATVAVPVILGDFFAVATGVAPCGAEMNGDGMINVFDLVSYLDAYFAGSDLAERTGDGVGRIDIFDLLAYIESYFNGLSNCR